MSTDNTAADSAEGFDFDAWLSGARAQERAATVYGRGDLVADLEQLEEQYRAAKANPVNDDRLGATSNSPDAIAARITDLQQQLRGSARTFRFRALDESEIAAVYAGADRNDDGDYNPDQVKDAWIAKACISTTLTPEQVGRMRTALGAGQSAILWDAAFNATKSRVSVPFSLAASPTNSEDSSTS